MNFNEDLNNNIQNSEDSSDQENKNKNKIFNEVKDTEFIQNVIVVDTNNSEIASSIFQRIIIFL